MAWRYQAVWTERNRERAYSICEIYLDDDKLTGWSADPSFPANGEDWDELQRDLGKMYEDCWNWEPVAFADLRVGMRFTRRPR